jgi:tRNA-dihydrouridine synthase B
MQIGAWTLSNPWILAPMAGASDLPFRGIARAAGASATLTELVSAKGLLHQSQRTERYLARGEDERPFWVQLFGTEPEDMAAAAERAVELGADLVDVNMGCPVRKVTRAGAGAALHGDLPRASRIVEAMVKRVRVPITAKIRLGWDADTINYLELGRALEGVGCAAITLHARTRAQLYAGRADWSHIRRLVEGTRLPIIGNGDVSSPELGHRMLAETGCAGVMIGRGALGDPWIFARLADPSFDGPSREERWRIVEQHLLAHLAFVANDSAGVRSFRPHLAWYAHGLTGAAEFRRQVMRLTEVGPLCDYCRSFFVGVSPT